MHKHRVNNLECYARIQTTVVKNVDHKNEDLKKCVLMKFNNKKTLKTYITYAMKIIVREFSYLIYISLITITIYVIISLQPNMITSYCIVN